MGGGGHIFKGCSRQKKEPASKLSQKNFCPNMDAVFKIDDVCVLKPSSENVEKKKYQEKKKGKKRKISADWRLQKLSSLGNEPLFHEQTWGGKEEETERTFIQCTVCAAEALVLHCHSTLSPSMTTCAWSGVTLTGSMSEGQRNALKERKKKQQPPSGWLIN